MNDTAQLFSLAGKSAFVTGATGYFGQEIAFALAQAGAHVFLNSRNRDSCDKLADKMLAAKLSASVAAFDINDTGSIQKFFKQLDGRALDIIINNAYSGGGGTIATSDEDDYLNAYKTTIGATHNLMKFGMDNLTKASQENGYASVINISSMYGVVSPDLRLYDTPQAANPPFYGAAKAALLQFTRYAAVEFAPLGIRVNALVPGPFPASHVQESSPEFIAKLENKVPLGRVGQAGEIRGPIVFLASSASSYITGSEIVIDGGWTCW